jgi:hypothetical protein
MKGQVINEEKVEMELVILKNLRDKKMSWNLLKVNLLFLLYFPKLKYFCS